MTKLRITADEASGLVDSMESVEAMPTGGAVAARLHAFIDQSRADVAELERVRGVVDSVRREATAFDVAKVDANTYTRMRRAMESILRAVGDGG